MARAASALGLLTAVTTTSVVLRAAFQHGFAELHAPALALASLLAVGGLGFALLACRFARSFVTHFELWPRSHLAVVRAAGCWREQLQLLAWREFSTGHLKAHALAHDPTLRFYTRSHGALIFEQSAGEAPHGWVALHRFLEKCSLPECPTSRDEREETLLRTRVARPTQTLRKTTAAF